MRKQGHQELISQICISMFNRKDATARNRRDILCFLMISFFVSLVISCASAGRYAISDTKATLMWQDRYGDELGFKIERRQGSKGIYKEIAIVGPNVTTFTDTGLNPGTTYSYRVRSFNSYGDSEYSNEIRVKVSGQ
jgi:hypothetical protein